MLAYSAYPTSTENENENESLNKWRMKNKNNEDGTTKVQLQLTEYRRRYHDSRQYEKEIKQEEEE